MTRGVPDCPLLAWEQSVLVPRRLLLGLQRRVWQLAFVPRDRAAGLRARLPPVSLGKGVMHSLLPTPQGREHHSGTRGTDTNCWHSQEHKESSSTNVFTEELTG